MTETAIPLETDINPSDSNKATARKALDILSKHEHYRGKVSTKISNKLRNKIAAAFALDGRIVYGKAFDAVGHDGDLTDTFEVQDIREMIRRKNITLYEVKSTNRNLVNFKGFFFSITTAEILVAQSLKSRFQFILVDIVSGEVDSLTLNQVYERAEKIYPSWSICLKK